MSSSVRAALLSLLFVITSPVAAGTPMIDAHSHYTAQDADALSHQDIVATLDAAGVSRIVISSSPPELARALHADAPSRVLPFLGIYSNAFGKAVWMHDTSLPERVEAMLEGGHPWVGLGELHLFARDAASPVFERLVRIADAHDLVLMIHGDIEVVDRIFEIAPEVRVLWAHLGTVPLPSWVERTLVRHAGRSLWIDTSVRDERIAPDGQLLPEWRGLIEAWPKHFVVAVDTFSTNRWHNYGEVVGAIRSWVDSLPPELGERLLFRNAEALFRLESGN